MVVHQVPDVFNAVWVQANQYFRCVLECRGDRQFTAVECAFSDPVDTLIGLYFYYREVAAGAGNNDLDFGDFHRRSGG